MDAAAALQQLQSAIATQREAAKRSKARVTELEASLSAAQADKATAEKRAADAEAQLASEWAARETLTAQLLQEKAATEALAGQLAAKEAQVAGQEAQLAEMRLALTGAVQEKQRWEQALRGMCAAVGWPPEPPHQLLPAVAGAPVQQPAAAPVAQPPQQAQPHAAPAGQQPTAVAALAGARGPTAMGTLAIQLIAAQAAAQQLQQQRQQQQQQQQGPSPGNNGQLREQNSQLASHLAAQRGQKRASSLAANDGAPNAKYPRQVASPGLQRAYSAGSSLVTPRVAGAAAVLEGMQQRQEQLDGGAQWQRPSRRGGSRGRGRGRSRMEASDLVLNEDPIIWLNRNINSFVAFFRRDRMFEVFRDPVPRSVPNYYEIIKSPMDLGTIAAKAAGEEYGTPEEFRRDMKLVVDNAKEFNPVGHPIHTLADKLWDRINKQNSFFFRMEDEWQQRRAAMQRYLEPSI